MMLSTAVLCKPVRFLLASEIFIRFPVNVQLLSAFSLNIIFNNALASSFWFLHIYVAFFNSSLLTYVFDPLISSIICNITSYFKDLSSNNITFSSSRVCLSVQLVSFVLLLWLSFILRCRLLSVGQVFYLIKI